jgi:hypothetical protein
MPDPFRYAKNPADIAREINKRSAQEARRKASRAESEKDSARRFAQSMELHRRKVEKEANAAALAAETARVAKLEEARAWHQAKADRASEEKLLADYQASQNRPEGRV